MDLLLLPLHLKAQQVFSFLLENHNLSITNKGGHGQYSKFHAYLATIFVTQSGQEKNTLPLILYPSIHVYYANTAEND